MKLPRVYSRSPLLITLLLAAGCASKPVTVRTGDKADVSFTCRFANGDLAVSSSATAGLDDGSRRSPVFMARDTSDPILVEAGQPSELAPDKVRPMEEEALQQLRRAVIGMAGGESRTVQLRSSITNRSVIKFNRIIELPKERRLTVAEFKATTDGREPKPGEEYTEYDGIPGRVSDISGERVTVSFRAEPGAVVKQFFGQGAVVEDGDTYRVTFTAEKGALVRSGFMVGRVVEITDSSIDVDFGDPFAGEVMNCDLKVERVEHAPSMAGTVTEEGETSRSRLLDALKGAKADGSNAVSIDTDSNPVMKSGTGEGATPSPGSPAVNGDLARVEYTATLEDGSLIFSTNRRSAENPALKKVSWYRAPARFEPESVLVGKPSRLPGLSDGIVGMSVGEKKRLTLPPDRAFGQPDPKKRESLPLVRTLPRSSTLPAEEYVKRFGGFPSVGKEVPFTPYFPARVEEVGDKEVRLSLVVEDGTTYRDTYGVTTVRVRGDSALTTLVPVIGAEFPLQEGYGIIVSADDTTFTVDTNHPLAGKTIVVDLELSGLTKATDLPGGEIPWLEDHDAGLAQAKKEGKPAVLVLHAEWCGYCKKLFAESLPDPRVAELADRFTWIRVDSDKSTDIKQRYGQTGFPMIVLFKADGTVAGALDGYQEPAALRAALRELL